MYTVYETHFGEIAQKLEFTIDIVHFTTLEEAFESIDKNAENVLYRIVDPAGNYILSGTPEYDVWDRSIATRFAVCWWDLWDPERTHRSNIMSEEACFNKRLALAQEAYEKFEALKISTDDISELDILKGGRVVGIVDYSMLKRAKPSCDIISVYVSDMEKHRKAFNNYYSNPAFPEPTSFLHLYKDSKLVDYTTREGGLSIQQIAFLKCTELDPLHEYSNGLKTYISDLLVGCIKDDNLKLFSEILKAIKFLFSKTVIYLDDSLKYVINSKSARPGLVTQFGRSTESWKKSGWDNAVFKPLKENLAFAAKQPAPPKPARETTGIV
jgi:hypothetical protein